MFLFIFSQKDKKLNQNSIKGQVKAMQNFVGGGHSYKSVMVIRLDHNTNRDIAATDVIETIGLLTYDDAHH